MYKIVTPDLLFSTIEATFQIHSNSILTPTDQIGTTVPISENRPVFLIKSVLFTYRKSVQNGSLKFNSESENLFFNFQKKIIFFLFRQSSIIQSKNPVKKLYVLAVRTFRRGSIFIIEEFRAKTNV